MNTHRNSAQAQLASNQQTRPIEKLELVLWKLLELSPTLSLSAAAFLLYIGRCNSENHFPTPSEVGKELSITASNASRTAYALGQGPVGEPEKGLGLIEIRVSETDRRRHTLHVTQAGEELFRAISETFA